MNRVLAIKEPQFATAAALACLLLVAGFARRATAQVGDESAEPSTLREFIDQSLGEYEVFAGVETAAPAEPRTVLRWANNARGSEDGVTLLYLHQGRPHAVACVYPWANRLEHGFGSLSRERILARRDGQVVWQPQSAGVVFADIPEAPAPDATRPQRLRQIKSLAKKFQATLVGWKTDNSDREELRLLSRPLYRYEPKDGKVFDGAVLAFVMGTDPEVLLLIEAVRNGGASKWQYAFARRTSGELEGRVDGRVAWTARRFPMQNDPRQPYFTLGVPLPPEMLAADGGE